MDKGSEISGVFYLIASEILQIGRYSSKNLGLTMGYEISYMHILYSY